MKEKTVGLPQIRWVGLVPYLARQEVERVKRAEQLIRSHSDQEKLASKRGVMSSFSQDSST